MYAFKLAYNYTIKPKLVQCFVGFFLQVMYGEKKSTKSGSKGHVAELATSVQELAKMEKHSQSIFLKMATDKKWFL